MRLSVIQFAPKLGDTAANIKRIRELISSEQSDFYVLPELANSGYNFKDKAEALEYAESTESSTFINALIDLAKENDAYIVSGFCEQEGDNLFNSSVLVGPEGFLGVYRKLHLFLNEKSIFEPGNLDIPVINTRFGKVAMLICFDWMFPEAWRKAALNGAQLIAHPSNLVLHYCQKVVPSYALTNRCFVATANRIGSERELTFTGQSLIASPDGEVIIKAGVDNDQVISADIDLSLAHDKFITVRNDAFADRRQDVYGNLNIDG